METALIKVDIEIPWLFNFWKKRFLLHEELSWINGKFGTIFHISWIGMAVPKIISVQPSLYIRHLFAGKKEILENGHFFERVNDTCLLLSISAARYKSKPVVPSFSWRFPGPFPKNFLNNSFQRIPSTVITNVCRFLPFSDLYIFKLDFECLVKAPWAHLKYKM